MAGIREDVAGTVRSIRGWSIAAGILLIIAGIVALAAPLVAALVAVFLVAWGLVFGGVAEFVSAYASAENRLWKVLLGVLYLVVGAYTLLNPGAGIAALALALGWLLLLQGAFSIFGAFQLRPLRGWGWWLADGIITVLLGVLIVSGWPQDSIPILSVLIGISLIVSGVVRLALATAL